ncbi:hypothetical protein [Novosphingobium sp.]|uniref:hypothetical protein n=1 Tax=Novosphingobium sp. TaxID=1874826 RepID=UPI00352AC0BA
MQPETNDKSRICLNFTVDGLTAYCNREALIDLRNQLDWLISSPPDEHYHCHVLMALENDDSKFDGKRPRNAGIRFSEGVENMKDADLVGGECVDLTFCHVTEADLDDIQQHQEPGFEFGS